LTGLRALVADLAAGVRVGRGHQAGEPSAASPAGSTGSGTSQRSPGLVGT
jgi:hypothetical protein